MLTVPEVIDKPIDLRVEGNSPLDCTLTVNGEVVPAVRAELVIDVNCLHRLVVTYGDGTKIAYVVIEIGSFTAKAVPLDEDDS